MPEQLDLTQTGSPGYRIANRSGAPWWIKWLLFIPFAAFIALGIISYALLGRDVQLVPSPLIGRPVRQFSLPPVMGQPLGLCSANLEGEVTLVNVFASWCVACRAEHPVLMELQRSKTATPHGLNYKDAPDAAAQWLDSMGDPYTRTGADRDGRVAIDWGVYGVPETFVVDAQGRIAYKQVGALTPEIVRETILPLLAKLREANAQPAQ